MKKIITLILAVAISATCLCGCGAKKAGANDGKFEIVTTIFPEYDWVMNILGDNPGKAQVTMLLDKGVDLHSYQPTADDILKISTCDVFIYVGGESDKWVADALKEAVNEDMIVINLLDTLGDAAREEELVEGMQGEEHDHEDGEDHEDGDEHEDDENHEDGDEHEHEEEVEYDEHVWLSLKNASALTKEISEAIIKADADNADTYRKNTDEYIGKLNALDKEYEDAVASAECKTLLFGDRFPFRYMTEDYGLDYYAAFIGCSAETEASFETITFLAGKVDELSLKSVIKLESSDGKIAKTIVENAKNKDIKILSLDSMQSATGKDVKNGTSYLSVMEKNLEVLKEALS